MSSSTEYQVIKSNPEKSILHFSVALLECVGQTLRDLGVNNDINFLRSGEFCNKYITRVTVVGSNPSHKSPDHSPFHPATKSRQFVDKWFEDCCVDISYDNLVDKKTENNKQLSKLQIEAELDNIKYKLRYRDKVIACGKVASMGLTMAGIEHFAMPHPSGLNHFWNDKKASEKKIEEMKAWLRCRRK